MTDQKCTKKKHITIDKAWPVFAVHMETSCSFLFHIHFLQQTPFMSDDLPKWIDNVPIHNAPWCGRYAMIDSLSDDGKLPSINHNYLLSNLYDLYYTAKYDKCYTYRLQNCVCVCVCDVLFAGWQTIGNTVAANWSLERIRIFGKTIHYDTHTHSRLNECQFNIVAEEAFSLLCYQWRLL